MRKDRLVSGIATLLLLCAAGAFPLGSSHPVDRRFISPKARKDSRRSPTPETRVHGLWASWNDWFHYTGDTNTFNAVLKEYAKRKDTPHILILHEDGGMTGDPGDPKGPRFDWKIDVWVRNWDTKSESQTVIKGHEWLSQTVAFSSDGKRLAPGTGRYDRTVKLWDMETAEPLGLLSGAAAQDFTARFSPDFERLAKAIRNRTDPNDPGTTQVIVIRLYLGHGAGVEPGVKIDGVKAPVGIHVEAADPEAASVATNAFIARHLARQAAYKRAKSPNTKLKKPDKAAFRK